MTTLDEVINHLNRTGPASVFEIGRIKPLAWVDTPDGPFAAMPFATYTVTHTKQGWEWTCTTDCELAFPCDSEEDGKQKAQEHWRRMIATVLEPAPKVTEGEVERAAQGVIDRMFDTYKARNGREISIEADDGEKCWIVHSSDIERLRAALSAAKGGEG